MAESTDHLAEKDRRARNRDAATTEDRSRIVTCDCGGDDHPGCPAAGSVWNWRLEAWVRPVQGGA